MRARRGNTPGRRENRSAERVVAAACKKNAYR
jgi:hypothetical protein